MGEGRGAGNGQSRVEKMRCPMYSHAQDGLRSKVRFGSEGQYRPHVSNPWSYYMSSHITATCGQWSI